MLSGNITSTLANTWGISPSWLWAFIGISCVQMSMFVVWRVTGNLGAGWILSMPVAIFLVFLGFLPVWVAVLYGVMGGAFVMLPLFLGGVSSPREKKETKNKILCYFIQSSGETVEKWVASDVAYLDFDGKRYSIDPSRISPKFYDKGYRKFFPIWVPALEFREGSAAPLSQQEIEAKSNNLTDLTLRIEKTSQKWAEYHNNLEGLLGIKTVDYTGDGIIGLDLDVHGMLYISRGYDWYIADKMPDEDIFKIVGLHKKDASKNLVYLLGKNKETGQPFLTAISSSHLEDDMGKCLDAKEEKETNGLMVGVLMTAIGSAMLPALMKGIVDGANTKGGNQ